MSDPHWFIEDGVRYRRDTDRVPLGHGETLLHYIWRHLPSGKEGTQAIVLLAFTWRNAEDMLFRLLARWNQGAPDTWLYIYTVRNTARQAA